MFWPAVFYIAAIISLILMIVFGVIGWKTKIDDKKWGVYPYVVLGCGFATALCILTARELGKKR